MKQKDPKKAYSRQWFQYIFLIFVLTLSPVTLISCEKREDESSTNGNLVIDHAGLNFHAGRNTVCVSVSGSINEKTTSVSVDISGPSSVVYPNIALSWDADDEAWMIWPFIFPSTPAGGIWWISKISITENDGSSSEYSASTPYEPYSLTVVSSTGHTESNISTDKTAGQDHIPELTGDYYYYIQTFANGSSAENTNPVMKVYAASDTSKWIAFNDDRPFTLFPKVTIPVEVGQTYYVSVQDPYMASGAYSIRISKTDTPGTASAIVSTPDSFEPNNDSAHATGLTLDSIQNHSLSTGEEDWFVFTVESQICPYAGRWEGTIDGDATGPLSFIIDENGALTGTAYSSVDDGLIFLKGDVVQDQIENGICTNGTTFSGTLSTSDSTSYLSGNWSNLYASPPLYGTSNGEMKSDPRPTEGEWAVNCYLKPGKGDVLQIWDMGWFEGHILENVYDSTDESCSGTLLYIEETDFAYVVNQTVPETGTYGLYMGLQDLYWTIKSSDFLANANSLCGSEDTISAVDQRVSIQGKSCDTSEWTTDPFKKSVAKIDTGSSPDTLEMYFSYSDPITLPTDAGPDLIALRQ